jgi:hypothetical protein
MLVEVIGRSVFLATSLECQWQDKEPRCSKLKRRC